MSKEILTTFVEYLNSYAAEQNLISQARAGCDLALHNCEQEDKALGIRPLRGWRREVILIRFIKHALVFKYEGHSLPYIETVLELYVESPKRRSASIPFEWPIGYYRLITMLDGRVDDDYLVLENDAE